MTVILYFKEGCPYCGRVAKKIRDKKINKDVEVYYCDKDFTTAEFKKKYGQGATFPRGYLKKGDDIMMIGDSEAILEFLDKNY